VWGGEMKRKLIGKRRLRRRLCGNRDRMNKVIREEEKEGTGRRTNRIRRRRDRKKA
jgi:hypothetical protein